MALDIPIAELKTLNPSLKRGYIPFTGSKITLTLPYNKIIKFSAINNLENLNLADDEKGWLGTGMDDVFDQRIPMGNEPVRFSKGMYTFILEHTMREDPLENILSTGIRVEKVVP